MGDGTAFVDGEYVAIEDAKISVFDSGFSNSDVVYDVTSTWHGQFFRLDDHVDPVSGARDVAVTDHVCRDAEDGLEIPLPKGVRRREEDLTRVALSRAL